MKDIKNFINEANDPIESQIDLWLGPCKTQDDYQRFLKRISFALYKAAQRKTTAKVSKTMPEFGKAANQFAIAVNSIRFDLDEVLKNDKIWRE